MLTAAVVMNSGYCLFLGFGTAWKLAVVFYPVHRSLEKRQTIKMSLQTTSYYLQLVQTHLQYAKQDNAKLLTMLCMLDDSTLRLDGTTLRPDIDGLWDHAQGSMLWSTGVH